MKIKPKTKPKPKPRKKSTGWWKLSLDELVHWAYVWESQQKNSSKVFREKETVTAAIFDCGKSTINRRNDTLVRVKVVQRLHKKERGKNQWFTETSLCVIQAPPECVVKLGKVASEVRAAKSPEPKTGTAQGCVNSGDEPCPKTVHIATTSIPLNLQSVLIGSTVNSSGVEPKTGTDHTRINIGLEPCPKTGTDPESEKSDRIIREAEKKLARLRRDYGPDEPITKAQSDHVAALKAKRAL